MEFVLTNIAKALQLSFFMFWEVLWPLILGFTLSAIIQAIIPRHSISKKLGANSVRSVSLATFYGAISSSCSYAAVALARSIFRKGGSFTSAMVFEIASTNLVIEMGIVLLILMGWQFAIAEFIGGFIMIIILFLIFKFSLTKNLTKNALSNANKGIAGRMEGHAAMDISQTRGSFFNRMFSKEGITSISHYFVMEWLSIWKDLVFGFVLAGSLAAWVPNSWWKLLFLSNNATAAWVIGPLIGPIIAIVTFVCSIGNIPLAVIFWRGGISFGGVISFIFADLIAIQILNIYRKYYGVKVSAYILITFYAAMVIAGYAVEILFGVLGIIPKERIFAVVIEGISWNYTSILNILFLLLGVLLVWKFVRTGGIAMLKMMSEPGASKS